MASSPVTSWQVDGETMETETLFLGSKITADGDCSHEIKRCLNRQSMSDAGCSMLGAGAWDDPERCCGEGGGRGIHVWERM